MSNKPYVYELSLSGFSIFMTEEEKRRAEEILSRAALIDIINRFPKEKPEFLEETQNWALNKERNVFTCSVKIKMKRKARSRILVVKGGMS